MNFFHSNVLMIDHYSNCREYTLLNFPLQIFSKEHHLKWYLYLPLNDCIMSFTPSTLTLSTIDNQIDYSTITFCQLHELDIEKYSDLTVDVSNINEAHIVIDISPYVYHCLQIGKSTCNLMLGALSNHFSLHFDKQTIRDIPRLKVIDESRDDTDDQPVAISLSLSRTSEKTIIRSNEVIHFHTIDTQTPDGIEYDIEKGELRILQTGFYLFHWHLNIEGSTYIDLVDVGLRNNNTGLTYPNPVPTSIQGQISGMAFVHVSNENTSFSLINLSNGDILLTNTVPCATILVHRI